jgi:hypothetical protein
VHESVEGKHKFGFKNLGLAGAILFAFLGFYATDKFFIGHQKKKLQRPVLVRLACL